MKIPTEKIKSNAIAIDLIYENIAQYSDKAELRAPNNSFAQKILDGLQEAICIFDMEMQIRFCNNKMADLIGLTTEQVAGKPLVTVIPAFFQEHLLPKINFVLQSRDFLSGELTQDHQNENNLSYRYKISHLANHSHQTLFMLSLLELNKTQKIGVTNEKRQHLTTIGDLIFSVSQELTTPLNQVCKHVDRVLDLLEENQDNRMDYQLNGIMNQVYRISSLAHNLVAIAKQSVPTYVNLNINEIILDAIESYEQDLGKRAALNLHLEGTLPSIVGDPFLLMSVFQNLIRVADELAGDDAVPRLRTDICKSKKYVTAIFETRGSTVQLGELNKIFELFQGKSILSPGAGLGLYLSKRLLEVQHCKFRIAGSSGAGNIIELSLPVFSLLNQPKQKAIA